MKQLLKIIWAIAALWFPALFAKTFVPEIVNRLKTAEFQQGVFSLDASDFWTAGTLLFCVMEVLGIGIAAMTPFWFEVSKRCRMTWLVVVTLPLLWFLIYGLRMWYQWGRWSTGIDAFEWWCFLALATWPIIVLGYGYPELLRRLFLHTRANTNPPAN